ncbi:MAG: inorganic pyrophosphatase [Candidatus Latescibacteria bacterium]|jgi:inorganic pyrophosphatase|nr:inorganic pyrophosphatase [Candidatus Latescibacterota bacterium]
MKPDAHFWNTLDNLVAQSEIVIDRPKGSANPRYPEAIYPFDYGYLANTASSDGDGIDIWLGSLPDKVPTAIICTVDLTKRDSEIKILLGCTPDEMHQIQNFHSSKKQAATLIARDPS